MVEQPVAAKQDVRVPRVRINWQSLGLLGALILLSGLFSILSPYFLQKENLLNIGRAVAIQGITAAGMTIALVSGGLDLSVSAVIAASGVLAATLLNAGVPLGLAIAAGIGLGVLVGLLNGLIVTRLRINPLITTLGTMSIVRALAYVATGGVSMPAQDETFRFLGRGHIATIPAPFAFMLVIYAIVFVVLRHTTYGARVYAIGGNPVAARLAGINVDAWRLAIYVTVAASAGFSGVLLSGLMGTAYPYAAQGYELDVIAAVILGGASLAGGKGTIQGTFVGVLILGVVANGLVLLNVETYYQLLVRGLVLLIAVAADQLRTGGYK